MTRRSPVVAFALLLSLLSGCSLVPDFVRPAAPEPQAWQAADSDAQVWPSQDWWLAYRSSELDRLIDTAKRKTADILATHFPRHIPKDVDDAIRARYPVRLPRSAMGYDE